MIGVSIEMIRQRVQWRGWSRTTDTQVHCRSQLGRWVRRIWRKCALEHEACSEDWRARPWCALSSGFQRSALLQRFGSNEDSWQHVVTVIEPGEIEHQRNDQWLLEDGGRYCGQILVGCRNVLKQRETVRLTWVPIGRSESIKTPRLLADEDRSVKDHHHHTRSAWNQLRIDDVGGDYIVV